MKQQKATEPQYLTEAAPTISVGDDNPVFTNLASTLSEIRKLKGVLGYILRSKTAAIIDLTQREANIEYAMLSSQIYDCSHGIAKHFNLADIESMLVEGTTAKVLCMGIGENKISVFMEKTCAHAWIAKRILL
jgi:predicted regulator of Ras-like GTPase activity (Roadblock/LC7/MglB family)